MRLNWMCIIHSDATNDSIPSTAPKWNGVLFLLIDYALCRTGVSTPFCELVALALGDFLTMDLELCMDDIAFL